MSALRFALVCFLASALAACSSDTGVHDVQFGQFSRSSTSVKFEAGRVISRSREPAVGWAFSMRAPPTSISITEILAGPPGAVWEAPNEAPGVQIAEGGRVATVETIVSNPGTPFFFHNWSITESDPVGTYMATLFIDGKMVRKVEFVVVE